MLVLPDFLATRAGPVATGDILALGLDVMDRLVASAPAALSERRPPVRVSLPRPLATGGR